MKYNTITKQTAETVPSGVYGGVDYHGSPPDDVAERAGWVDVTPEIQTQIDADKAQADAEAAHARSMAFQPLIPQAHLFRLLLRRNFGDGAETNHELTAEKVTEYFAGLTVAGTITALQASDGVLLARMFEDLAAWNGTGETWTLPWEVVP
jgi:hypothetical protein